MISYPIDYSKKYEIIGIDTDKESVLINAKLKEVKDTEGSKFGGYYDLRIVHVKKLFPRSWRDNMKYIRRKYGKDEATKVYNMYKSKVYNMYKLRVMGIPGSLPKSYG